MDVSEASGTWRVVPPATQRMRWRRLVAAGGGALVLAAGVAATVAVHRWSAQAEAGSGWRGKVVRIARNGPSGDGLRVVGSAGEVEPVPGAALPASAEVTTDAYTRARLELDDGTTLVLDRSTSISLPS